MTEKALYQPWREEEFGADVDVQALTPIQRWMYRTLCQKAFVCSTRPFPPDDDSVLWKLAGCPSRAIWDQNKEAVRDMFTPRVVGGNPILYRKRLDDDWKAIQAIRDRNRERANMRWHAGGMQAVCSSNAAACNEVKEVSKELKPGAHEPRPVPSHSSGKVLTPSQRRYSDVGKMASAAIGFISTGPQRTPAELKEQVKQWAAEKGIPYDADKVYTALDVAEERVK